MKLLVIKGRAERDILAHQEEINLCRGKMEDFLCKKGFGLPKCIGFSFGVHNGVISCLKLQHYFLAPTINESHLRCCQSKEIWHNF